MKNLNQICEVLHNSLLDINSQCENLKQSIQEFGTTVSFLPVIMIRKRLLLINIQICIRFCSLTAEHGGKGYVFVIKSDILLGVYWVEKEFSPEDKNDFSKRGELILSMKEISDLINKLSEQVDSGQFAEAVDWINRYEPSFTNNQVGIG